LIVTTILCAPAYAQISTIDQVLAIVDNEAITLSEYIARHDQESNIASNIDPFDGEVDPRILEKIIDERLQVRQAENRGIRVSEEEVTRTLEFIANQNGLTVDALVSRVERDGLSVEDFRESLRIQQLIRKLIDAVANSRVVVSEQEIENYINARPELRNTDGSYEVSHLIVLIQGKSASEIESEKENMQFIRDAIISGQPFDEAVRSFSDAADKDEGGYLGWRTFDQLPALFINALREMDPTTNNISNILQSDNGLHILKLHDRRGGGNIIKQQLVKHILIQPDEDNTVEEAEALAADIYQQLQNGEAFEKLARLYSQDAQSRSNGGSLGWINPDDLDPEFQRVAASLPIGSISNPVATRFGLHIIQVLDRRETDMSDAQAMSQARQAIFRRKAEEIFSNWYSTIRERAFIEYVGV
jgi:peptidyl-prolyl cis-trans isomerase SurA